MGRNLGPLNIKDSYEGLVQISGSARDILTDGSGSVISNLAISASYATTASFALNVTTPTLQTVTDAGNITTNNIQAPVFYTTVSTGIDEVSVSLETLGPDEPFIITNSSKVLEFDSATSASKFLVYDVDVQTALTASGLKYPTVDGTAGQAVVTDGAGNLTLATVTVDTGSFYISSSVVDATATFNKGDGTTDSLTINNVANAVSASYALSASFATTASYAENSVAAFPFTGSATILGTLDVDTSGSLNGYTITSGSLSGSLIDNLGQQSVVTSQSINHMVFLTQAEYNALTPPEASTFYAISGSDTIATGSFVTTSSFDAGTRIQTFTKADGSTYTNSIPGAAAAGAAGLITGSGGLNTIISAPQLTTNPAVASAASGIAIGNNAINYAAGAILIGDNTQNYDSSRINSIYIGSSATGAQQSIGIGNAATVLSDSSVGIGRAVYCNGNYGVAIGYDARADGTGGTSEQICIGYNTRTFATGEINIGDRFRYNQGANDKIELNADTIVSGSLATSGSVTNEVNVISDSGGTTTMDCSLGNFFTLTMPAGGTTALTPTNIQVGQTINVLITQNATASTLTYAATVDFANGVAFTISTGSGDKDILTLISFDGSNLQATGTKNFI